MFIAIPPAQARDAASRAPVPPIPARVHDAAQVNCSTWLPVDASLLAGVCIRESPGNRFQVRVSVHNRSTEQHTVAVFTGFRVGANWNAGRNFPRGQCGLSVDPGETVYCDSRLITITAATQFKWGVARVVHTDEGTQRTLWTPMGLR
jgi:hypothetical protein